MGVYMVVVTVEVVWGFGCGGGDVVDTLKLIRLVRICRYWIDGNELIRPNSRLQRNLYTGFA